MQSNRSRVGSCLGRFVVEKCGLKVMSPESAKGVFECAIGNIGIPLYGGTLVGTVVYPKENRGTCQVFDDATSFKSKPGGFPTFLLVNRGDTAGIITVVAGVAVMRQHGYIACAIAVSDLCYNYGKLDKRAVLKAICSGFQEMTEPPICLSEDIETNECLENSGGCWQDKATNITAGRDTFRGRVCECPIVNGVKFSGDGYTHCEAFGASHCTINNGGCWRETQEGKTYSACFDDHSHGCKCPPGFKGDGVDSCEDVDECKEKLACQCSGCKCKNTWGSYECSCSGGSLYMREHDTCISKNVKTESGWGFIWSTILGLIIAGAVGYAFTNSESG
ncbi:Vacuolar-sorting receptor 1 [Hibiscus syriacus]|uniref:Vacuolar-sorting receptor 1 n=1 Tax=Hibiscus syriacus TaxID=106335 RepID=A0A6A2ZU90_HIBSY|nr:Vacuolar-sorting receptor 1 [Hibiscus syriacus]